MLFDNEEWKVLADTEAREYLGGVMDNSVAVVPLKGDEYTVHIVVPTSFFPYLRDVLKYTREQLLSKQVSFYLTQMEKGGWLFGFDRGRGELDDTAMWRYSKMPAWARRQ